MNIEQKIERAGVVPVVSFQNTDQALKASRALIKGGINVVEITLRTDKALESIAAVKKNFPDLIVGAGTVLSLTQCKEAVENGANFIVSPGINTDAIEWCVENFVQIFPGVVTPTEISSLINNYGINRVKYFPAEVCGGVESIKILSEIFPKIKFMPTGGVNLTNIQEYISEPSVFAIGGSWICSRNLLDVEDYQMIENNAKKAKKIIEQIKYERRD